MAVGNLDTGLGAFRCIERPEVSVGRTRASAGALRRGPTAGRLNSGEEAKHCGDAPRRQH